MYKQESPAPLSTNSRRTSKLRARFTLGLGFGILLAACGGDPDDIDGGSGSGGAVGSGGALGSGGASSSGGAAASGGAASGGASSGGAAASGGAASGGAPASGGSGGMPGGTGGEGMSGGGPGSGGSEGGTCEKGTTAGNEVLFIGESFIAMSDIPEETSKLAQAAGSLMAGEQYVDKSVSGTWIGNGASNSIPAQYNSNKNGIRFVLMNGGGNDCWQGGKESDRTNALNAAEQLFTDMDANGVEKIVYFFYPDPIDKNSPGQYASLKACLDLLRPDMKALCDAQTAPKCYWVDLRETWDGHSDYTSDGIHVAGPGAVPTATAIFGSMTENCVAP